MLSDVSNGVWAGEDGGNDGTGAADDDAGVDPFILEYCILLRVDGDYNSAIRGRIADNILRLWSYEQMRIRKKTSSRKASTDDK